MLGYTGIASIDGTPTDEWLAQRLLPFAVRDGNSVRDPLPCFVGNRLERWYPVNLVMSELAEAINRLCASDSKARWLKSCVDCPLVIQGVGYRWRRRRRNRSGRMEAFIAHVRKEAGALNCSWGLYPCRRDPPGRFWVIAAPRDDQTDADLQWLGEQTKDADPERCRIVCLDLFARVAARRSTVGRAVMMILIVPTPNPQIVFRSHLLQDAVIGPNRILKYQQPYAQLPWIIGPLGTITPTTLYGNSMPLFPIGGHFRLQTYSPRSVENNPICAIGPHFRKPLPT